MFVSLRTGKDCKTGQTNTYHLYISVFHMWMDLRLTAALELDYSPTGLLIGDQRSVTLMAQSIMLILMS